MSSDSSEHLVQMANDIGNYFRAEPNRQVALDGIANHINKFWAPRMRKKFLEYVQQHGGAGLDELPRAAVAKVKGGPISPLPTTPPWAQ
jgi:formate dehydrogenase subunit delta